MTASVSSISAEYVQTAAFLRSPPHCGRHVCIGSAKTCSGDNELPHEFRLPRQSSYDRRNDRKSDVKDFPKQESEFGRHQADHGRAEGAVPGCAPRSTARDGIGDQRESVDIFCEGTTVKYA